MPKILRNRAWRRPGDAVGNVASLSRRTAVAATQITQVFSSTASSRRIDRAFLDDVPARVILTAAFPWQAVGVVLRRAARRPRGRVALLTINGIPIDDTFAEAFPMTAARLLVTAETAAWVQTAA